MIINASARPHQVLIGGTDLTAYFVEFECLDSDNGQGLITQQGQLILRGTGFDLNERTNPSFWQRGQQIQIKIANAAGTLTTLKILRILQASYDPASQTQTLQVGCKLKLIDFPVVRTAAIAALDPGLGSSATRDQVINGFLGYFGLSALGGSVPGGINYPIIGESASLAQVAGRLAYNSGLALWVNQAEAIVPISLDLSSLAAWSINSSQALSCKHLPGQPPSGKIRATSNRKILTANSGTTTTTQNIYDGTELIAIIETENAYTYPNSKTLDQATRAPTKRVIPSETSSAFIVAEQIHQENTYAGVASSGGIGSIESGRLTNFEETIRRRLGSFADYVKIMEDAGASVAKTAFVDAQRKTKSIEYDTKGRVSSIVDSLYEDPRLLAGLTKGIDWPSVATFGLQLTKRTIQVWKEARRNDWEHHVQEYDARCRTAPNSIPSGADLDDQIRAVLVKTAPTSSTSQNQPPATERAPAQFAVDTEYQEVVLNFTIPSQPFAPQERTYSFDLLPASVGGVGVDPISLAQLGTIAGKLEFAQSQQVELEQPIADEWFSYQPYQSFQLVESSESGIYAIGSSAIHLTSTRFTVGCRGLRVAQVVSGSPVYDYTV